MCGETQDDLCEVKALYSKSARPARGPLPVLPGLARTEGGVQRMLLVVGMIMVEPTCVDN